MSLISQAGRGRCVVAAALLAAGAGAFFVGLARRSHSDRSTIVTAAQALRGRDFDRAEALARDVLADHPDDAAALLLAGEAASRAGRFEAAAEYYGRLPESDDPRVLFGHVAAADMQLRLVQFDQAEATLLRVLSRAPAHAAASLRLAYLLSIEGRRSEAAPHWLAVLRAGQVLAVSQLGMLADPAGPLELPAEMGTRKKEADCGTLLARACLAIDNHRLDVAEQLLGKVIELRPALLEPHVRLGELLLATSPDRFVVWRAGLPRGAEEEPRVWAASGQWLQSHGNPKAAMRCFWEAARRNPNLPTANYHLAQLLNAAGKSELAAPFAERARQLDSLAGLLARVSKAPDDATAVLRCAAALEQLGRLWEAWGWCQAARQANPAVPEAEAMLVRIGRLLKPDMPRTIDAANPSLSIALSSTALPDWKTLPRPALAISRQQRPSPVAFDDVSNEAGLNFQYYNGHDPKLKGMRPFEFGGGGVAVLDYDADGWPDLYFTQGCAWPPQDGQCDHLDQLFRNSADGRFTKVTAPAGLVEDRFSQGATVGDFNCDGFDDLYVANVGENRLFMNNGDGTFSDVTKVAGLAPPAWTASCLLADVNGDGLADIYDVNYLMGDDLYRHVCHSEGKPRACLPSLFLPEPDALLLNRGNGSFGKAKPGSGLEVPGGNGLGIVAADFDGSGRLSLFVANDQDANFFFVNQTAAAGSPLRLLEQGVLRGLAFDGLGRAQACMGVAAGDADGDQQLDLFVTNYYRESNTLYLAREGGLYVDASVESGLSAPSYNMLGFGTQFLDAQLDGLADLVVANGHLEDLSDEGIPFAMRPQFFQNRGGGKFVEVADAGDYFQRLLRGRGLARLDFNRDGRDDFVVSHLDSPAALVANHTRHAGHFLALRLHGTRSARDAIGARVTLSTGSRRWAGQLTAGDGYMASNQRQIIFGLGDSLVAEEIVVEWPSGLRQRWAEVPADGELILIEGRDEMARLPR